MLDLLRDAHELQALIILVFLNAPHTRRAELYGHDRQLNIKEIVATRTLSTGRGGHVACRWALKHVNVASDLLVVGSKSV